MRAKCEKHHSYITHFDFSDDSTYLQSNCGGYELQFFSVIDGEHVHSASITKDVDWSTFTCTLGWAIQAIWPEYVDGIEVHSCHRSNNQKYVATADDAGRIKVFRYPCLQKGVRYFLAQQRIIDCFFFILYNTMLTTCFSISVSFFLFLFVLFVFIRLHL